MNNNIFESCLRNEIFDFINHKQSIGYKYITDISKIKLFDKFLKETNYNLKFLTKECIDNYILTFSHLAPRSKKRRYCVLKEFSSYLKIFDKNSFLIMKNKFRIPPRDNAYIFNKSEIRLLLHSMLKYDKTYSLQSLRYYTITGLLAFTGIRCQECFNLNIEDFDIEHKLLVIKNAKFKKDRLIPISDSVADKMNEYLVSERKRLFLKKTVPFFDVKSRNFCCKKEENC